MSSKVVASWERLGVRVELEFDAKESVWTVRRHGGELFGNSTCTLTNQQEAHEYFEKVCDGVTLRLMEESLAADLLSSYSDDYICEAIKVAGGSPDAIGREGVIRTRKLILEHLSKVHPDEGVKHEDGDDCE